MGKKRARKELQSDEAFEKALREEIALSAEFDLPMTLISACVEGGWREDAVRRALDSLRAVDLVAQPDPDELLIVLPNTRAGIARVVEERLEKAVPEATLGVAPYARGNETGDLLEHARASRRAKNPYTTP